MASAIVLVDQTCTAQFNFVIIAECGGKFALMVIVSVPKLELITNIFSDGVFVDNSYLAGSYTAPTSTKISKFSNTLGSRVLKISIAIC